MPGHPVIRDERARDLALLLLGAALLFLLRLGARDLWNPNEPLYGRAVVEMSRSGDWSLPTFNGQVFAEKPILYYWLALATSRIAGIVDELTLRLPSALAGLAAVAGLYLLVLPYAGRLRAVLAAGSFATTEIVFWSARSVQMDLLLAACTLGAVLAASRVLDHGAEACRGWALAGLAAGLGVLAKGPVGVLCPALAVAAYAAVRPPVPAQRAGPGSERRARRALLSGVCGVAGLLVVAAPWFGWLLARGEWDVLHEMVLRQSVTRFVSPWDHARPWWYYLVVLWIDMAPWALLLPCAVALSGRGPQARRLDRLAWAWLVSTVAFFSLSASKRSPYLLPAAPAVAILAAAPLEHWIRGVLGPSRRLWLRALFGGGGAFLAASGLFLAYRGVGEYPALVSSSRAVAALLVTGGTTVLLASLLLDRRRPLVAPAAFAATVVALYLVAAAWVLPAANAFKSARPFCDELARIVPPGRPLRSYRSWKWRASYVYYADREIPPIDSPLELERYFRSRSPVFLLVERDRLEEVLGIVGDVDPLLRAEIGSNAIYLLTNP